MAKAGAREREKARGAAAPVLKRYYVQVVRAKGKGQYEPYTPVQFDSIEGATRTCEQLQAEFDQDCEPCRVYVLDSVGVPVHAGGAR